MDEQSLESHYNIDSTQNVETYPQDRYFPRDLLRHDLGQYISESRSNPLITNKGRIKGNTINEKHDNNISTS